MMKEENLTDLLKNLQDILIKPLNIEERLPLEDIISKYVVDASLSATEQKIYYQLVIEFQIILSKSPSFQKALFTWDYLLDDRLQEYGLTRNVWDRIQIQAKKDPKIKAQYDKLVAKIDRILKKQ
ncbi:MAG: hypothetical protein ACTSW1_16425 [Candidatus Hodarchaeales archaeon]